MIALLQRVSQARVLVNQNVVGEIDRGILAFIGVEQNDSASEVKRLTERVLSYRLFSDGEGKMNLDVRQSDGALLLVDSTQRLKTLAYVLVLSGLGQAVYGSLALAVAGGGNASGTFVNRNHFAAYLVLCLAVGIGLLIASMGRTTRAGSWRDRLRRIGEDRRRRPVRWL